jgi:hypothetical protein
MANATTRMELTPTTRYARWVFSIAVVTLAAAAAYYMFFQYDPAMLAEPSITAVPVLAGTSLVAHQPYVGPTSGWAWLAVVAFLLAAGAFPATGWLRPRRHF